MWCSAQGSQPQKMQANTIMWGFFNYYLFYFYFLSFRILALHKSDIYRIIYRWLPNRFILLFKSNNKILLQWENQGNSQCLVQSIRGRFFFFCKRKILSMSSVKKVVILFRDHWWSLFLTLYINICFERQISTNGISHILFSLWHSYMHWFYFYI